jgi:hypothetical protein
MSEDCSSVEFREGGIRGDFEEPGMHVSGEHILASTAHQQRSRRCAIDLPEPRTSPITSVISSNLMVINIYLVKLKR